MERLLFLLFCVFFYGFVLSQKITAKVVGVKDGDTFVVLHEKKEIVVRLEHIDAPEKNQPFGSRAKKFASDFCFGKTVVVIGNGKKDRNGRWIGEIFYNNQNLNKELVRNGLAWHYKRYSKNANYADLETVARKKKVGLWQEKEPIAPWEWRRFKKKKV
ncbi:MAG: thermonuclease family protein [Flavobacteriia bacterium]|nr:thermonuclease family protein [Flavobacteriia bacterium]MBH2023870.1 thermonuclease family protein [Flavobacteriales bacterium]